MIYSVKLSHGKRYNILCRSVIQAENIHLYATSHKGKLDQAIFDKKLCRHTTASLGRNPNFFRILAVEFDVSLEPDSALGQDNRFKCRTRLMPLSRDCPFVDICSFVRRCSHESDILHRMMSG